MRSCFITVAIVLAAFGCSTSPPAGGSGSAVPRRPPLLVYLHGFGAWGDAKEATDARFRALAEAEGWSFIAPLGFQDPDGFLYWPASPACCDRYQAQLDGVHRIRDAIDAAQPTGPVLLAGLSNGGFMAHRMACEAAPGEFAAIVSLAGAGLCAYEIHGADDPLVLPGGGVMPWFGLGAYPATRDAPSWDVGPWGHAAPPAALALMLDYMRAALHDRR